MSFIVSARKYRPDQFESVIGQAHISQTLKNALRNDHVAHAFLFCGPRGVGKTTCARILAKILNCENRTEQYEACNTCHSCKSFNENASFNIFELDAASNNGVEHIRALVEQVRFPPQQGKYKVYIIDEVHMLTQAGFNAFLKTLEEPPAHAIFILATTEKHKIIPTILSRCQIYDFRRIQPIDVVQHLQNICEKEGIDADTDALHTIGVKADGAMRDALSIFDRIVSAAGKKITYQDVIENLNILDYDYYFRVVEALLAENMSQMMLLFDEILRKGFDPEIFIEGLGEHLRNLLVCKDEQTLKLLEAGEMQRERYRQQAKISPIGFLISALNLTNECDIHYKTAQNKRFHVENSLIKMTYIQRALVAAPLQSAGEKKNDTVANPPLPISNEVSISQPVATVSAAVTVTNHTNNYDLPLQPVATAIVAQEPIVAVKKNLDAFKIMGKISDLTDIYAEVKEEQKIVEAQTSRLNIENLMVAWAKYGETIDSPSLKTTLESAELQIKDSTITVTVGSTVSLNSIRQTLDLVDFLREELHDKNIMLDIQLDQQRLAELAAAQAVTRPLTNKEKYEKMMEVNPLVDVFRQHFDLRFLTD
jgi:DNA polymerase III subunit gamma/tau